jgi:hypothetical protein
MARGISGCADLAVVEGISSLSSVREGICLAVESEIGRKGSTSTDAEVRDDSVVWECETIDESVLVEST